MSPSMLASVSTPMPPTSRPIRMTTLPNVDQCVAMFTVDSPVTQIADTAVNSASASGVAVPDAAAIGSDNTAVMIEHEAGEDDDREPRRR